MKMNRKSQHHPTKAKNRRISITTVCQRCVEQDLKKKEPKKRQNNVIDFIDYLKKLRDKC